MNLASMIRSHDEAALQTLTNKGLVRRAQRDLSTAPGEIASLEAQEAVITIADNTVRLRAKGPALSSCTCRASGVCRHIVHAILLLRDQPVDQAASEPEPGSEATALTQLCALSEDDLRKFAGADWGKACALAVDDLAVSIAVEGINTTVRLEEFDATVTFMAGHGLKGAAYKGPKTRKRQLVTLAALRLRHQEGMAQPDADAGAGAAAPSAEFLDQAQSTIERAVSATLAARSVLAHDLLLDLAISVRCEALPRLAAELRRLAAESRSVVERYVDFDAESFLLSASRSYALLQALRLEHADPQMLGAVRKQFEPAAATEVWPLGVSRWRSKTGARGLTAYVLEPASGRWLTLSEGRGAGASQTGAYQSSYDIPVWGVGVLSSLVGRRVTLAAPMMAADGSISPRAHDDNVLGDVPVANTELTEHAAIHRNWNRLKKDLSQRLGQGLRRRAVPIPAAVVPKSFGALGFDDINQEYCWEMYDDRGTSLQLTLPGDEADSAIRLWNQGKKIVMMVVEATLEHHALTLRPVSVFMRQRKDLLVHHLDFDEWPVESRLKAALSALKENLATPLAVTRSTDPLEQLLVRVTEALIGCVTDSRHPDDATLEHHLEACGLSTMKTALVAAKKTASLEEVLRAAYVVSELRALTASR